MKKELYITITGVKHYYGMKPFKPGKIVKLIKDYKNEYDNEAIAVTLDHIDKIGYVANSTNTVYQGTFSAGRIYDKMDETAFAEVMFLTHEAVIARFITDGNFKEDDEAESDEENDNPEIPDYSGNEGDLNLVEGLMSFSDADYVDDNGKGKGNDDDSKAPDYSGEEDDLFPLAGEALPSYEKPDSEHTQSNDSSSFVERIRRLLGND